MNILVTGGAGFIGTNLIKKLVKKHKVFSIDNYETGNKKNHIENCTYYDIDLSKEKKFKFLKKIDFIFHLSASARIAPSFKNPKKYFKNNVIGTFNIVHYAANYDIPIVYAGSGSHHGGRFCNPYTFTKDLGEDIVNLYRNCFDLKTTTARFYNVYGEHELTNQHGTLIGKLKKCFKEKKYFRVYGDGEKKRDFTHVEDIIDALILIMNKKSFGYNFELGTGENFSVNDVIKMFGHNKIKYSKNQKGEMKNTLCDNSLAKRILGWEPKNNLKNYIDEIKKSI
jgi:UDP-glucose 4-epimerase